jgi:hypothetical protein
VKGTEEKPIEIDKRLLRDTAAALRRYASIIQQMSCVSWVVSDVCCWSFLDRVAGGGQVKETERSRSRSTSDC